MPIASPSQARVSQPATDKIIEVVEGSNVILNLSDNLAYNTTYTQELSLGF